MLTTITFLTPVCIFTSQIYSFANQSVKVLKVNSQHETRKEKTPTESHKLNKVNVITDLQYEQNKEVSICYSLELFKQILWQETQCCVLRCGYTIVLQPQYKQY